ncbi:MAG: hypothetical protein NVSMB12_03010 [Acidimicrobiales bacterium]
MLGVAAVVLVAGLLAAVSHRDPGAKVSAPPPSGADPSAAASEADTVVAETSTTIPTTTVPTVVAPEAAAAANDAGPAQPGAATPAPPPPPPAPLSEPNRAAVRTPPAPDTGSGAAWPGDFPDPFVLRAGATYYAFGTQSGLTQVQTLTSTDLRTWKAGPDALPKLPSWAQYGYVWGPSVLARPAGYVLYYATRVAANGRQCLSRAVSVLPQGPYVDTSSGPLVCQLDRGGSIDPSPFVDADGTPWLVWKSEGTLAGEPTRLWSARLSGDGLSVVGPSNELLHTALPWEEPIIEGPSLTRTPDGHYVLFYSANRWQTAGYAIGWASCASPAGPCGRQASAPLLASHGLIAGPGSPEVFSDIAGATHVVYCAWTAPDVGYPKGARRMHLGGLTFSGGRPILAA